MVFPSAPLYRRISGLVILFLCFGLMMLFSATAVIGTQRHHNEFYFVLRQGATALVGIAFMVLVSRFKPKIFYQLAFVLMFAQLALVVATLIPGFSHQAQGACRWLRIGGFIFQPSELAKITVPIYIARLLCEQQAGIFTRQRLIITSIPLIILFTLLLKQPDMGTAVLLATTILAMLFVGNVRIGYLLTALAMGAGAFLLIMLQADYRRRRLFAFLNPWADPQGQGFQTIQSFLSLHSGGILGAGIGNGTSKLFYLPEVHTDFIFSLVGEELGFIGAMTLLLLLLYFVYSLFRISILSRDNFSCFLSFGLTMVFVLQIIVNLGGVTGILPVKGLTLPFISWGRSALLVNLFSIGILLGILRTQCVEKSS